MARTKVTQADEQNKLRRFIAWRADGYNEATKIEAKDQEDLLERLKDLFELEISEEWGNIYYVEVDKIYGFEAKLSVDRILAEIVNFEF